jgi:hypothetical protein
MGLSWAVFSGGSGLSLLGRQVGMQFDQELMNKMGPVGFHFGIAPQVLHNFGNDGPFFVVGRFLSASFSQLGPNFPGRRARLYFVTQSFLLGQHSAKFIETR